MIIVRLPFKKLDVHVWWREIILSDDGVYLTADQVNDCIALHIA
jgi:hypothetical protein